MSIDLVKLVSFLDHWQSLSGALIGAALPISFALFLRWLESRKELSRGLGKIEKMLVLAVNSLYEAKESLELFLDRIREFRQELEKSEDASFTLDSTNFPSCKVEVSEIFLNTKTRSLYLGNNLMRGYILLKNINSALLELREEFQLLKQRNFDIVLSGKVTPEDQKRLRIGQLVAIEDVLSKIVLSQNIPITVKSLLKSRIILSKYLKSFGIGKINRWYFDGFNGKSVLDEKGQENVEKKFEKELNAEFLKVEGSYRDHCASKKKI